MKNLKTNAQLTVRARWYDWRQSTINQLIPNLFKMRNSLKAVRAHGVSINPGVKGTLLPTGC